MKMEGRIHSNQKIANNFNGFNNLCFRKLFIFYEFFRFCSPFLWLNLTKDRFDWFHSECLVNLLRII